MFVLLFSGQIDALLIATLANRKLSAPVLTCPGYISWEQTDTQIITPVVRGTVNKAAGRFRTFRKMGEFKLLSLKLRTIKL